jgi:hypothetical protein
LADRVPVDISVPLWMGEPDLGYPWRFSGGRWIEGKSVVERNPGLQQRMGLADSLAEFRAVFHAAVVMVFANETGELQLVEEVTRALEWVL